MRLVSYLARWQGALRLLAAVGVGGLLRLVVGLEPVGWLAWLVPGLLLGLTLRWPGRRPRLLVALAAVVGTSVNFPYYRLLMPGLAAAAIVAIQALLWVFLISSTRRIVVRYQTGWTVVVYPVLWVALDTLMAALLPDGNWASLAYSQATYLPLLQVVALLGVPGLLFLLALGSSALALAVAYGTRLRGAWWAYGTTAALLVAALGYGERRLQRPVSGPTVTFGLAAIDDAIGPQASAPYTATILRQYQAHVAALAARGAQVIVLPEKIGGLLTPGQAQQWQRQFSNWAAQYHVWLEAGVGIDTGQRRVNLAWLFTPAGTLTTPYQKHFLAPPEREFVPDTAYAVRPIAGQAYGLAICKDMHFATLGRAYGQRQVAAMLVPAWDFYVDRRLAAGMTATRGVENGYAVVRASRDGLLTVSDAYGRTLCEQASAALPGSTLLARVQVGAPLATLYTHFGNWWGWLCVAGGALLLGLGRQPRALIPVSRERMVVQA
ncbi:MAG: nitrilase-related carbon-nitrogen hydrolase [Janthinobacterium lividum]